MDLLFLPNVSIPRFNGNPGRWNEFWDLFNAMVNNRKLEPYLKLFQLRSCLEGPPEVDLDRVSETNGSSQKGLLKKQLPKGKLNYREDHAQIPSAGSLLRQINPN
uniref:Uncharacterized protein n=1 Tax=Bursaphelenchus xylophilus TaxID=6326 RepID=A0A1I7S2Q7_BURXY